MASTSSTVEAHLPFAAQVAEHSIANGATGDAVEVGPGTVTATIIPTTSAKVQYTTSRPSKIRAGTATWIDWASGTVVTATSDIPQGPITGIRGVSISGTCTLEVVQ